MYNLLERIIQKKKLYFNKNNIKNIIYQKLR